MHAGYVIRIRTIRLLRGFLVLFACFWLLTGCQNHDNEAIKVGVLHSLTGSMAISELPVVDATLLAIEEINASGGLLGRKLVPVVADGKSDPATFASEAERLINHEKVAVIFGCWTSASRKMVLPVAEQHKSLLFYPIQYEGMEMSPYIIYTGAVPNQQIFPAISWAKAHLGKRLYLIGSDYIFPRTANWLIRKQAAMLDMQIIGETYQPLGSTDFSAAVADIARLKPDAVINTINGDSNISFYKAMYESGLRAETTPVISFSIGENELTNMPLEQLLGHYAAWSYFQSIDSGENRTFIKAFKARFGQQRVLSDPMEAAYFGMKLWAQAVSTAQSIETSDVKSTLKSQSFAAPEGIISIALNSQHTWKRMRIGKVTTSGQFEVVWTSPGILRPDPFPLKILRENSKEIITGTHQEWGKQWSAPADEVPEP